MAGFHILLIPETASAPPTWRRTSCQEAVPPIPGWEEFTFFWSEKSPGYGTISEATSGTQVVSGRTHANVYSNLIDTLSRFGKTAVQAHIDRSIATFGKSPWVDQRTR